MAERHFELLDEHFHSIQRGGTVTIDPSVSPVLFTTANVIESSG